jgi:hypothetical protein
LRRVRLILSLLISKGWEVNSREVLLPPSEDAVRTSGTDSSCGKPDNSPAASYMADPMDYVGTPNEDTH